jgi:calcineurin-like phosphoesterase family protein
MPRRFFTSDTHLGHALMMQTRGFASIEEHNAAVISRWNKEVRPEDTVFLLGDAVMGRRRDTLPLFYQMNGTKHLISGNHDDCWPGHANAWTHAAEYLRVFASVQPFMRLSINGQLVLLSHFPYAVDRSEDPRFTQYRLKDEGAWLLHGHTHSSLRRTSAREIHVGMDAWELVPVAETRIVGMMRVTLAREEREKEQHVVPAPDAGDAAADAAQEQAFLVEGVTGAESNAG